MKGVLAIMVLFQLTVLSSCGNSKDRRITASKKSKGTLEAVLTCREFNDKFTLNDKIYKTSFNAAEFKFVTTQDESIYLQIKEYPNLAAILKESEYTGVFTVKTIKTKKDKLVTQESYSYHTNSKLKEIRYYEDNQLTGILKIETYVSGSLQPSIGFLTIKKEDCGNEEAKVSFGYDPNTSSRDRSVMYLATTKDSCKILSETTNYIYKSGLLERIESNAISARTDKTKTKVCP